MTARGRTLILLLAVLLAVGCTRHDHACSTETVTTPVDPALLAFLSRARSAHHIADGQEEQHPELALATLRTIVDGPLPGRAEARPAEVREVLADTGARIADLESQRQDFEGAVKSVAKALLSVPDPSYFRGHLFEVLGLVEERRAQFLSHAGKAAESEQARARALAAFEQSMSIQAEVIRAISPDAGNKQ